MEKVIYIQLLNEGTIVYRPVPSIQIEKNIFKVGGFDIFDPEDEIWEFAPGTLVIVEEKILDKMKVLMAVSTFV